MHMMQTCFGVAGLGAFAWFLVAIEGFVQYRAQKPHSFVYRMKLVVTKNNRHRQHSQAKRYQPRI